MYTFQIPASQDAPFLCQAQAETRDLRLVVRDMGSATQTAQVQLPPLSKRIIIFLTPEKEEEYCPPWSHIIKK